MWHVCLNIMWAIEDHVDGINYLCLNQALRNSASLSGTKDDWVCSGSVL